jgi:lytic murein transglycosylase
MNLIPNRLVFIFQAALLSLALAPPARADFQDCLAGLRGTAVAQGISPDVFDRAAQGLQPDPEVIALSQVQPEFKTPIWDYLAGLVDEERVSDGKAAMAKWGQALASAQSSYGVDPATVTAVWGVESNFGQAFGNRSVIRSLATLSCDGRRQAYFRTEFIAALKILAAGDIDPQDFKGSWAGAFGHTQFMPSTFLHIAVDGDGDGRRDLIKSVPDALASTANYLHKAGWQPGLAWGVEVKLPAGYSGPSGRTKKEPMSAWAARGITRIDGRPLGEGTAGLLLPAGPSGPAFLVTRNFDAIYGYNAAESYALAISLLSDQLRGRPILQTPWPTDDPGLSRAARRELQTRLIQRGYDLQGKIDGVIGDKTREAIADFQGKAGLNPDGRASVSVLNALRR